jgi:Cdc6-like AAA superfamily ATPase
MDILIDRKALSDAPLDDKNGKLFYSRTGVNVFAEDILYGMPTCYLISGYRGVGKTSFIRQVKNKIRELENEKKPEITKDKKRWWHRWWFWWWWTQQQVTIKPKIVFVETNFTTYHTQTRLLRKLIRELYLSIKDDPVFIDLKKNELRKPPGERHARLLERLYDQTFEEVGVSSSKKKSIEISFTEEFSFSYILTFLLPLFFGLFFWSQISEDTLPFKDWIYGAGLLLSIVTTISNIYKLISKKVTEYKQSEEITRRSLYDDDIADYHFCRVLKNLAGSYKIVFVLDELDKQGSKEQKKSISEIKPYLVSGLASFIIVAGQKLSYKFDQARNSDDSVLKSLFARTIHVNLFSYQQLENIFINNIISEDLSTQPDKKQLAELYCHYLAFESKGVARTFVSFIRQELDWVNGVPGIIINAKVEKYEVFRIVNEYMEHFISIQVNDFNLAPSAKDFYIMQMYRVAKYILMTNGKFFKADQILPALALQASDYRLPLLEMFPFQFAASMVEKKILISQLDAAVKDDISWLYRLASEFDIIDVKDTVSEESEQEALPVIDIEVGSNEKPEILTNLRNIVYCVYRELYGNSSNDTTLSKMIQKIRNESLIPFGKKDVPRLFILLDEMDQHLHLDDMVKEIFSYIRDAEVNIPEYTYRILEYSTKEKAKAAFMPFDYRISEHNDTKVDLILENADTHYQRVLIATKLRKDFSGYMESLEDEILRFLKSEGEYSILFMVLYLNEGSLPFTRQLLQFEKAALEMNGMTENIFKRIRLAVVPTNQLPTLRNEFDRFIKENVYESIRFDFNKPDFIQLARNDEFIDRIFPIANRRFKAVVSPVETKSWRFGFTFSKNLQFPPINTGRHENEKDYVYVHLCIGDYDVQNKEWIRPELFKINVYPSTKVRQAPLADTWTAYSGEHITFEAMIGNDPSRSAFTASVYGVDVCRYVVDLSGFDYCLISGWRDYAPYLLGGTLDISMVSPEM